MKVRLVRHVCICVSLIVCYTPYARCFLHGVRMFVIMYSVSLFLYHSSNIQDSNIICLLCRFNVCCMVRKLWLYNCPGYHLFT